MGYTFFEIPKLTMVEINMLIEEFNRQEKEKQKASKKIANKK